MIPAVDLPVQAMTSKQLYTDAVHNITQPSSSSPDLDYDFLSKQYPVTEVPDLAGQVAQFLALPKSFPAPRETVWVFTFGTWDIWALAALPLQQGVITVKAIVASIFDQIEILYSASLDSDSPAYSDFYAYAGDISILLSHFNTHPTSPPIESFRVIIPRLFDISLTPGWQSLRQDPPPPHSKPEHVSAAAHLASVWDREVDSRLAAWNKHWDQSARSPDQPVHDRRPYYGFWNPSTENPTRGEGEYDVLYTPYPGRSGTQVDLGRLATDAIIETQLRAHKLTDGEGRGSVDETDVMYFDNVVEPCVWEKSGAAVATGTCENSKSHLFYGPFTLDEEVIRETAKTAAREVVEALY